jgi:hypothetical protein
LPNFGSELPGVTPEISRVRIIPQTAEASYHVSN